MRAQRRCTAGKDRTSRSTLPEARSLFRVNHGVTLGSVGTRSGRNRRQISPTGIAQNDDSGQVDSNWRFRFLNDLTTDGCSVRQHFDEPLLAGLRKGRPVARRAVPKPSPRAVVWKFHNRYRQLEVTSVRHTVARAADSRVTAQPRSASRGIRSSSPGTALSCEGVFPAIAV